MKKNIEIISLIYKSVSYLDFIVDQLKSDNCKVDGWEVGVRVVANDATLQVLDRLKELDIKSTYYQDPKSEDFYLNRVYRAWNCAAHSSTFDNICFVNSDMAFSKDWLSNLLKYHDGINIPCSRLVESGKKSSGEHGISNDFGRSPKSFRAEEFSKYVRDIKEETVLIGGLYMPCIFNRKRFIESPMYPQGNVFIENGKEVVGYPNDRKVYMSGDQFFFNKLEELYSMKHITIFDSIVYHMQEGEMDE